MPPLGLAWRKTMKTTAIIQSAENLRGFLRSNQTDIVEVMSSFFSPQDVIRMSVLAVSKAPKLLSCTRESFQAAIMEVGSLGLDFGGVTGEAHLIPFGSKVQLVIGYRGFIKLARRSGKLGAIEAKTVNANDEFDYELGTSPRIVFRPSIYGDRGAMICAYAVANVIGAGIQAEIMRTDEIEAIRERSPAGKSGPWVTDFGMMARKTVLRRLSKLLPQSTEMERAAQIDEAFDAGPPQRPPIQPPARLPEPEPEPEPQAPPPQLPPADDAPTNPEDRPLVANAISEKQRGRFWAIARAASKEDQEIADYLKSEWNVEDTRDITWGNMYDEVCKWAGSTG